MTSRALLRALSGVVLLLACASVKTGGASGDGGASGGGAGAGGSAGGSNGGHGGGGSGGGSGGGGVGAGGSAGDVGGNDDAGCGTMDFDLHSGPANVLLVQDRSGSMKNPPNNQTTQSKWDLTTTAVKAAAMMTDSSVSWGLKTFPEGPTDGAHKCLVTNVIDLPVAAMNAANLATTINATTPDGDGTPTGDAILVAFNYMKALTLPGQKFMVLSTDGDPNCGSDTVTQLRNAASMGIKTFVIGIGSSDNSPANLNAMADAGGEPRPLLSPLDSKYYSVNSQADLATALAQITGQVISCTFDFQMPPPLTNGVHVTVNGTEIYDDPTHTSGWDYTDTTYKQIQLYGPPCQQIQAGNNQIHILFDCKPVIVP
jgi:hypothetical protein